MATDEKAKMFDPLIANIQLYYYMSFEIILTDEDAESIAESNPEKDANHYLRAAIQAKSTAINKVRRTNKALFLR